jgi:uncharacterized membrane protein
MKETFSDKIVALMGMVIILMAVIAMFRGEHEAAAILFAGTFIGWSITSSKTIDINVTIEEKE